MYEKDNEIVPYGFETASILLIAFAIKTIDLLILFLETGESAVS